MFGSGFGVAVTAVDLCPWPAGALSVGDPDDAGPDAVPDDAALVPPGGGGSPARLGELLPVGVRSDAELAAELQRIVAIEARLMAYKTELVAAFAARRPDCWDVPRGAAARAARDARAGAPSDAEQDATAEDGDAGAETAAGTAAAGDGPTDTVETDAGSGMAGVPVDASGRPEFIGTSEFFADELALVLNCSRTAASTLIGQAFTLLTRLPGTWAALADGRLDWPRARGLTAELGAPAAGTDPAIVAAVEAALLPTAAELSVRGLRAAARRELIGRDAAATEERRAAAERAADVTVRPAGDGMAELAAFLPAPLAAALHDTLDGYARLAAADGDARPLGQLRVGVLGDLVLRPWDTTRPPLTATLTVVAPLGSLFPGAGAGAPVGHGGCDAAGGTAPAPADPARAGRPTPAWAGAAEVNGQPITAAQLRRLLEHLDALCPGGLQAPTGGALHLALVDPTTGALRATLTRAELERLARRGCPQHPPGTRRPDAGSGPGSHGHPGSGGAPPGTRGPDGGGGPGGDPAGDCGCPVLDRPPPVDRYRPSAAQHRYVTTRDRSCRHPGCTNRAGWADLDHVVPHAVGGPTDCANLCCLCRRHHRLKTDAPGWTFTMSDDGLLTVTTPSGVTRTTRPPGLTDPAPGAPPRTPSGGDDPPPF
ncbi:HNH endonuclease [Geodermatophilus sp. YIM 151500]|uniref:HNH endonuclease signature motif containing protein n=1 Tax=Geodermatophilus sp. YIM 151500 TaxID=2984531 RepID=UPI0021E48A72|nr:HNH endonuclease signature motif containing protein [Geodermatophilus sp. YIM 151500]MCV2490435.1 HNH endonuclease [Geodermatophilus sp. YIM 151500]